MHHTAHAFAFQGVFLGNGPRPTARSLPVTPVRQIGEDCGLLACIESIARDRNLGVDQVALRWRYPHYRRKPASALGRVGVRAALEIMADLGLSSNSETVHGRALAGLAAKVSHGVLLAVEDHSGGIRWWRIAEIKPQGLRVMQPEAADPGRLVDLSWQEVETRRGCALAFDV